MMMIVIWVSFILWSTLVHRETGDYGSFHPLFQSYQTALIQPEVYRSNFMNILLFFPTGLFLFDVLPWKKSIVKFLVAVVVLKLLSIGIECTQFFLSLGSAEMDDILHNTLGAVFGAGAAWFSPWAMEKVIVRIKTWRTNHDKTK